MAGKTRNVCKTMLLLPLVSSVLLWLCYGFPAAGELDAATYYVQLLMVALTIVGVPVMLKYINKDRFAENFNTVAVLRMSFLAVVAVAEVCLYYFLCATPMFFYLAVMTWLSMFFAVPVAKENSGE